MLRRSCVICISNEVEYLNEEQSYKILSKNYIIILTDLPNAVFFFKFIYHVFQQTTGLKVLRNMYFVPLYVA